MPAKQNTRKLTNYLIFMIKIKYKESKIVKKCLGWINLLVVSRGKCNMALKGKILLIFRKRTTLFNFKQDMFCE